ncbi:alkylated DNA repair protein alkB like 6 [[Emmonsia] crescens]|uniref:Alkylated DNA repair protein alkB like 6 n=1 Tax=[Emmonsia] crescens TaxID=73230 RepID=A0A0G2J5Z1_9EURO|nr:alkylated DNA repair protein alkB like 6 [Emmonsia crescens UAMH 3008]
MKITSVPIPRWTHLSRRRLQTWPSALSKSNTLLASPLPQWLISPIISRYTQLGIFRDSPHKAPNHVLINEYQPGQGIMPHEDGAAYYPVVATVSLGTPIVLEMSEKPTDREHEGFEGSKRTTASRFRILQERRSLLITTGKLYTDYLHGIEERKIDADLNSETVCNWGLLGDKDAFAAGSYERENRISLTYRDVLKVSNLGKSMKFSGSK